MISLLKLCILYISFLNLFTHNHAQDIIGAILGGVQNGINLVNNNLGIGRRDYPDYGPPANRDVSYSRSNDVSQSNENQQNDSEEPYNSNSEQRQGDDSNWNSEEYDKGNSNFIQNKESFSANNRKGASNQQNISPNGYPGPFNGHIQGKPIVRKPALNKQKPVLLEKERLDSNVMTHNKDNLDPSNINTVTDHGSTTSIPLMFLVNSTVIDDKIPSIPVINGSLLNRNLLNSTNLVSDKTTENDKNKNVLKPITKRKFFFQAKPVVPLSEEVSENETIYYIDFD